MVLVLNNRAVPSAHCIVTNNPDLIGDLRNKPAETEACMSYEL